MLVIRAASGYELSMYEKSKLANIEDNAQENKIESIAVNGQRQQIDPLNKEVNIKLGNLAFKQQVTQNELSDERMHPVSFHQDVSCLLHRLP